FADPDHEPRAEERAERMRQAAGRRTGAPKCDGQYQERFARHQVGDPSEWQSDTRVDDGERRALHHAELRIGQMEARPDGIDQNREDQAVGVGEDRREGQESDTPPRGAWTGVGAHCKGRPVMLPRSFASYAIRTFRVSKSRTAP